jgi:hypothetical protein
MITEVLEIKPVPVQFCPPKISQGLPLELHFFMSCDGILTSFIGRCPWGPHSRQSVEKYSCHGLRNVIFSFVTSH